MRPISTITPYPKNAKKHPQKQVEQVAASIAEFGFNQPIVVDADGVIIVGHGRYEAARLLGMTEVPVLEVSLPKAKANAYRLADNKLNESDWDMELVIDELKELEGVGFDITLTGFAHDLVIDPSEEDDLVPDVPAVPLSAYGDLYEFGGHRVLCGSATDMEHVKTLMDGKRSAMVFTDPPYLMSYTGSMSGTGPQKQKHDAILNDDLTGEEGQQFLYDVATTIRAFNDGAFYITFYRLGIDWIMNAVTKAGLKWRNLVIWKKNHMNLSNSDYKSMYEPMIVGWADDYVPVLYGWNQEHNFFGRKGETDVWEQTLPSIWEIDRTKNNDKHPTMKPVELMLRAIKNSSKEGDIVLDLFLGSGSTLIAAHKAGRVCYGTELDPKYIDVCVQRWCEYTGITTVKLNGKDMEWKLAHDV